MSELLSLGYQPITSTNVKKYRLLERPVIAQSQLSLMINTVTSKSAKFHSKVCIVKLDLKSYRTLNSDAY